MIPNKKTASPVQAGTLGEAAANTTARKNTIPPTARQYIKQLIVCAACWGLIPTSWAEWGIARLGVRYTENNTAAAAQRRRILEHLKHDTLTTLQARSIGIMHPAARCMELRKLGHQIVTERVNEYCPGGVRHRVARYRLEHSAEAGQ